MPKWRVLVWRLESHSASAAVVVSAESAKAARAEVKRIFGSRPDPASGPVEDEPELEYGETTFEEGMTNWEPGAEDAVLVEEEEEEEVR